MADSAKATEDEAQPTQVKVWLGNRAPIEVVGDGDEKTRRKIPVPKACTYVALEPQGLLEQAGHVKALWPHVSDAEAPAWVASTSRRLAELISDAYGGVEVREPENPDEMHGPYRVAEPKNGR